MVLYMKTYHHIIAYVNRQNTHLFISEDGRKQHMKLKRKSLEFRNQNFTKMLMHLAIYFFILNVNTLKWFRPTQN